MSRDESNATKYPYVNIPGKIYPIDDWCGFIENVSLAFSVFYATKVVYNENEDQIQYMDEIEPGVNVYFNAVYHYINIKGRKFDAVASIVWFQTKPKEKEASHYNTIAMYRSLQSGYDDQAEIKITRELNRIAFVKQKISKFVWFTGRNGNIFPVNDDFGVIECFLSGAKVYVIYSNKILIYDSILSPLCHEIEWGSRIHLDVVETKTNDRSQTIYLASLAWNERKTYGNMKNSKLLQLYLSFVNRTKHYNDLIANFEDKRNQLSIDYAEGSLSTTNPNIESFSSYSGSQTMSCVSQLNVPTSQPSFVPTIPKPPVIDWFNTVNKVPEVANATSVDTTSINGLNGNVKTSNLDVNIGTIFTLNCDGGFIRCEIGDETREIEFIKEVVFIDGLPIKDAWNDINVSTVNFESTTISSINSSKHVAMLVWNGVRPSTVKTKEEIIQMYKKNLIKLICDGIDSVQEETSNDHGSKIDVNDNQVKSKITKHPFPTTSETKATDLQNLPLKSVPKKFKNVNASVADKFKLIEKKIPDTQCEDSTEENALKTESTSLLEQDICLSNAKTISETDSDFTTITISEIVIRTKLQKPFTVNITIDPNDFVDQATG